METNDSAVQTPQAQFAPVAPPVRPLPPQPTGFPAIQGVYNYMCFGVKGEMYKVDEVSGEWRLGNDEDLKVLMAVLAPAVQRVMSTSLPNFTNIESQLQHLLKGGRY